MSDREARPRILNKKVRQDLSGKSSNTVLSKRTGQGRGQELAGVSVVPEPGSYAMLLAGLGIVGAIIRRRKNLDA